MNIEDYKRADEVLSMYAAVFAVRNYNPTLEQNRECVSVFSQIPEAFELNPIKHDNQR